MKIVLRIVSILTFIALWKLITLTNWASPISLPAPEATITALHGEFVSGYLVRDIVDSLRRVLSGFAIGSIIGLLMGIMIAANRWADGIISPIADLLRPIPPLAWVPLAIIWLGLGDPPAIFLVAIGAFFPMLTAGASGIRSQDPRYLEHARLLGLSRTQQIVSVMIPQALPEIFSGLRTALGISWMIVVAAELVGAQSGLGYMIQINRAMLRTDAVLGGMLVIGLIGLLLTGVMGLIERAAIPWKRGSVDD